MNSDNKSSNNDVASERLQELSRRGLNAATGGAWNRVRKAPVVGSLAKAGEQKIADKLGNNRLAQKLANPTGHTRPELGAKNTTDQTKANNPKNGDVGSRNLQNSLANRARNLLNNRKKKKKSDTAGDTSANNDNNDTSNNNSNTSQTPLDDYVTNVKKRIKIKVIIYGSLFLIIILFFLAILVAVFGVDITSTIPAVNPITYGTDDFQSVYEEGTNEYKNEIKYYEKLKSVSEKYSEENGEELKTSYIHATLIYIYYNVDMGEVSENNDSIPVDYSKMTNMVDKIVSLMKPVDNSKNIDYEKNGEFYNNLKNSSEFRIYYQKLLKEKDIDTVLSEIFDLAKGIDDITYTDDTVITTETTVTVGGGSTPTKLTIKEYIANSIYASTNSFKNGELAKAYTIAYSTNLAAENKKLTIDSSNVSASNSLCSVKDGCSYDNNGSLVSGGGEQSSRNAFFYNGKYYYKIPLSSSEMANLNKEINSVFGNVLVNDDGTYPKLNTSMLGGTGDYKTILTNSYGNLKIKNIGEDSYILDGSYGTHQVKTSVIFYDQNDYGSYTFCGKRRETIATSGCGTTSMAIIVSTYENNRKYDPVYMMNTAYKIGYCGSGISGTGIGFFKKEANTMNYKYYGASKYNKKDLNLVLSHLSQGHLVIAHMGAGHFTNGGHYMVLGGVDPETKKVYVYDPYNKVNSKYRKTGSGWYSFNDLIVKEAKGFYIVWKG